MIPFGLRTGTFIPFLLAAIGARPLPGTIIRSSPAGTQPAGIPSSSKKVFIMSQSNRPGVLAKVYQDINKDILDRLDRGIIPWKKPWNPARWIPMNLITKQPYRGWNYFCLEWAMAHLQPSAPWFLTRQQARSRGGDIKPGAVGMPIVKWVDPRHPQSDESGSGHPRYMIPKCYEVYSVDQTEGIAFDPAPRAAVPFDKIAACEDLLAGMSDLPNVLPSGNRACYSWIRDVILMPPAGNFPVREQFYSTLFHEIIHSTGHPKRLNRPGVAENDGFGQPKYSREELIAEFGAVFLCGLAGVHPKTVENSAAYIQGWKDRIAADGKALFCAATKAQAAIDFLLPNLAMAGQPVTRRKKRPVLKQA
jgi:antirestriction protein ArdC